MQPLKSTDKQITDRQVKSERRVADYGEVFTSPDIVNAMLDLVKQEAGRIGMTGCMTGSRGSVTGGPGQATPEVWETLGVVWPKVWYNRRSCMASSTWSRPPVVRRGLLIADLTGRKRT